MTSLPANPAPHSWMQHRLRHVRRRPRFAIAWVVGVVLLLVLLRAHSMARSLLLSFDAAAGLFIVLSCIMMARSTRASIAQRAKREDEARWVILGISVVLPVIVLIALTTELEGMKAHAYRHVALSAATIVLAWLFMNVMFALHYAHDFYGGEKEMRGGLEFPGTARPDYWDFMYFAVVVSMTFQVSDVQITCRSLRRLALLHGMIAFFFNVFIIAITVNIVAAIMAG